MVEPVGKDLESFHRNFWCDFRFQDDVVHLPIDSGSENTLSLSAYTIVLLTA
jgi:hypothetical protein